MADSIHDALSAFRDTMLMSVAKLEFQLRDTLSRSRIQNTVSFHHTSPLDQNIDAMSEISEIHREGSLNEKLVQSLQDLTTRMCSLESRLQTNQLNSSNQMTFADQIEHELMTIESQQNTRNILVSSVRSTPALAAAVAAANPPSFVLNDSDEEEEVEEEEVEVVADTFSSSEAPATVEVEEEEVEEEEVEEEEVEEEEVEVEEVEVEEVEVEEVEEEEVEEEAVEVEEFLYKGQTYQRDAENNVYLDGTQVGTWNGKKIIAL